jgi:hypothetical protein
VHQAPVSDGSGPVVQQLVLPGHSVVLEEASPVWKVRWPAAVRVLSESLMSVSCMHCLRPAGVAGTDSCGKINLQAEARLENSMEQVSELHLECASCAFSLTGACVLLIMLHEPAPWTAMRNCLPACSTNGY